jgi:glutamine synthetase
MHVHQSLVHEDSDVNAFADASAEHGLSDLALSFVAGQLAHARGMAAVLAPLVNSYKRLVPGFEAPVYVSWGQTNRSALIRVPQIQPGRLESTRLELRCPDPSCNPYLAFAVMLRAGLDGIQRNLEAPPISNQDLYEDLSEGNLETLPGSLGQALQELQRDELVCETLGPHILDRYVEAKATEWRDYISHVSNWELERYLPIY